MTRYRFVGSQDPGQHRLDRVVDGATVLELNGDPVSLSDAKYERISRYARLQPVDDEGQPLEEPVTAGKPAAEAKDASSKSSKES